MEEGKQLDFNAPLLSVRRFAAGPPPAPPPSSSSAKAPAAASSRAEVGGGGVAGERSRRSSLPFYKSDLKSGPVRNPGVVPFVWEKSPGRRKDGSFPEDSPARRAQPLVMAPKPPPGRIPRRPPDEKEESMSTDASDPPSNSSYLRRSSPPTSVRTTITTRTAALITSSTSTANAASSSKTLQSSREEPKGKARTPPVAEPAAEAPISKEQRSVNDMEDEEEDAFSDALDTLSRTESFFMNCSISGMTGGTEAWEHSGRFSADPQVQDFMMGRFLPAAQAMATESPLCPPRKAAAPPRGVFGNGGELRRPAASMPPVQRSSLVSTYPRGMTHQLQNGEDSGSDDDDDDDAGRLPMKGCGFLPRFCLRGSFGLLNPVLGVKARGRMPLPGAPRHSSQLRISRHGSAGDGDEEHSWEDVYKYKLRRESQALGEEGSRITSESNRLSYWTDSQTPDGSSPYRSNAGGISPYRNDAAPFPFHERRGFLGVPKSEDRIGGKRYAEFEQRAKDDGEYWETSPHLNSKEESGSASPVVEKTVYVDSVQVLDNSEPLFCSSDTDGMVKCLDQNFDMRGEGQRIETSPTLGVCKENALLNKTSEVSDAEGLCLLDAEGLCLLDAEGLGSIEKLATLEQRNSTVDTRQDHVLDGVQPLKAEHQGKNDHNKFQPLLPPPLPKSPTESWLWRTLPSISSKNAIPQTFLGFQFHHKKQVTQATSTDPKWESMVKTSVLKRGQVRFADELVKPANVD